MGNALTGILIIRRGGRRKGRMSRRGRFCFRGNDESPGEYGDSTLRARRSPPLPDYAGAAAPAGRPRFASMLSSAFR